MSAENQDKWVSSAQVLPCWQLEKEVARVAPREAVKYVNADRLELKIGISEQLEEKLRRVQDLESQRTGRAVTLEEALESAVDLYVSRKDPARKNAAPASVTVGRLSQSVKSQVLKRDEGRCTHFHEGERCESTRWLDVHHIQTRAQGGSNHPSNLTTLCQAHHRMEHVI